MAEPEARGAERDGAATVEELRRNAALLDAIPDFVWLKGLDGRYLTVNAAFAGYLGRPAADVVGRLDEEFFAPADVRRFREQEAHVVARDLVLVVEETVADADGAARWYETVKAPFRDALGRVRGTVGATRDVTRSRLAEERLRRFVETLPAGAAYVEGERVTVNRAVQAITGWAPEEIATLDAWFGRLFGEEGAAVRATFDADRRRGLGLQRVLPLRHRDGSLRWIELGGTAGDGYEVWLLHDVTARHEAEARLERQHRLLEEVQTLANVGSWEWDTRDGRVELSPVLRRIYGLDADEPFSIAAYFERVHPEDRARVRATVERAAGAPTPIELDHRIVRPDGIVRLIHMRGRPQADDAGALVGYVGSSQDVTERAQLEARLAQAEKLEAVGQLAGGVAHDFNNMLTAVMGNLDLAASALPVGSAARLDLAEARRAAERAAELTRQLLAYGRKQVLSPRVLDVNRVVEENATLLRRALPSTVAFDVAAAPALPHVRADPGQLVRVLMNLVLNARDAVRAAGGGAVHVETAERRVSEEEASRRTAPRAGPPPAPGRYVAIVVRDTGTGMDAATCARVFEPFFTTKPVGEGTGLGLATVFGIVTQSGGAVDVESEPGRGTAFTVLLPAVDADAAEPPATAPGGTETILLVEDDPDVRGVARRVLERHGYAVLEAGHGADALRCVAERGGAVDLVLTDVRMPGIDGRELARRLRAEHPTLRVALTSGYANEGAATGDLPFVAKPYTAAALLVAVRAVLDAR